jgi:hypothetical protein
LKRAFFLVEQAAEQTLLDSTDRRLSSIETDNGVFGRHHRPKRTFCSPKECYSRAHDLFPHLEASFGYVLQAFQAFLGCIPKH